LAFALLMAAAITSVGACANADAAPSDAAANRHVVSRMARPCRSKGELMVLMAAAIARGRKGNHERPFVQRLQPLDKLGADAATRL